MEIKMFSNAADVKAYTLAGNATLTLTSEKTGARYTFKVSQAKDDDGAPKEMWFVGLLVGPDNYSDYRYMGVLAGCQKMFKLTGKSKYTPDSIPVKAFEFFWNRIVEERMPPQMEIRHSGNCGRCGRKLTVPESVDSGLGPECRAIMGL
jgi:hypothetical protein